MFWIIVIGLAILVIAWEIIKWLSNGIDQTGKSLGLSKKQINNALDLWAMFNIGKDKK